MFNHTFVVIAMSWCQTEMNLHQVRAALQNTDRRSTIVEPRWLAEKLLVAIEEAIE